MQDSRTLPPPEDPDEGPPSFLLLPETHIHHTSVCAHTHARVLMCTRVCGHPHLHRHRSGWCHWLGYLPAQKVGEGPQDRQVKPPGRVRPPSGDLAPH